MMKFISKEEAEELLKAPTEELLNEVLSRVHNASVERVLTMIPDVISRVVANTTANNAMTHAFFDKNKDFKGHKDIVGSVIQDIDSKHPELDYKVILEKAEPIIREKINAGTGDDLPHDLPKEVNLKGNGVI